MNMSEYKLFTVEKDVKFKASQLTTQVMSKVFGLFPESILLLSDDGFVETADTDGWFHDVDDLPLWTVSGELINPPVSFVPGPPGIMPYSYQPPTASKASKRGRGKARWMPSILHLCLANAKNSLAFVPKSNAVSGDGTESICDFIRVTKSLQQLLWTLDKYKSILILKTDNWIIRSFNIQYRLTFPCSYHKVFTPWVYSAPPSSPHEMCGCRKLGN